MRHSSVNPFLAIIIAVLGLATTAIFVKLLYPVPTGIIAFYRVVFSMIILIPIVLLQYRNELKQLVKQDIFHAFISGLLLSTYFILSFESLNYTSVASSVFIIALQPIFIFIGTYFFIGDRFSIATLISLLIAFFGLSIIGYGDYTLSQSRLIGDALALVSIVIFSIHLLSGQKLRRTLSIFPYTFLIFIFSAFILFLYNVFMNNEFFNYSKESWGLLLLLALVPTFLGQMIIHWALKWVNTSIISISLVFEPIVTSIIAYFLLRETIASFQLLGSTFIVFGLFLFIMSITKKRNITISK